MEKDDDNQKTIPESSESPRRSELSSWLQTPYSYGTGVENYSEIYNLFPNALLQYSSSAFATCMSPKPKQEYSVGESSGTERKSDVLQISNTQTEGTIIINEGELELRRKENAEGQRRRKRPAEAHNMSEKRRRSRINDRLNTLQALLPNCNKLDKASMLDDAIDHIKSLQRQLETVKSMGVDVMPQAPYTSPAGQQTRQVPYASPIVPMGPTIGMGYGLDGPSYTTGFPIFPTIFPGPHPLLPSSMTPGLLQTGESGLIPVPPPQLPFYPSQLYPATTNIDVSTTNSEIVPSNIAPSFSHMPVTSQGLRSTVEASQIVRPSFSSNVFDEMLNVDQEARKSSDHDVDRR